MNYYCGTEDQEFINNKTLESSSLDINLKYDEQNNDLKTNINKKMTGTKKKAFKIPDHISSMQCN